MSEVVIKLTSTQESCEICLKENEHKTLIVFNDGTIEATYNLSAKLKKGASLDIYNVATTYKNATLNETIDLCDEEATCNILNVLLVGDKAHFASNIFINHLKKHTTSDFQNYAIAVDNANMILNNNAKIVFPVFEGEIVDEKVAVGLLSQFLRKIDLKNGIAGCEAVFSISCGATFNMIEKYKKHPTAQSNSTYK